MLIKIPAMLELPDKRDVDSYFSRLALSQARLRTSERERPTVNFGFDPFELLVNGQCRVAKASLVDSGPDTTLFLIKIGVEGLKGPDWELDDLWGVGFVARTTEDHRLTLEFGHTVLNDDQDEGFYILSELADANTFIVPEDQYFLTHMMQLGMFK